MPRVTTILGALWLVSAAVYATTLHVPSQYPTIQAGINAAVNGDTVLVADGTYTGTGNKDIDFLAKAIVVMSENGAESCIIDCGNEGRGFYFHSGETLNSVLAGFKIRRGYFDYGGGICCENSSPRITQCIITENTTSYSSSSGGGIYLLDSNADISDCIISWNVVNAQWNNHGGGIVCWNSSPAIVNCTIEHNTASDGGGMSLWGTTVEIVGCTIRGNSANIGGGIYCLGNPRLADCVIDSNVSAYEGGGILIGEVAAPLIENCAFIANSAHQGGGIWNFKSEAVIRYCEITANAADEGGGIYSYQWYANLYLEYCLISENSATGNGGGVYIFDANSTIEYCTISRNSAGSNGGGIFYYIFINPTVVNTIVKGNQGNGGVYFQDSPNADIAFSDFFDNEGGNFAGSVPPHLGVRTTVNANGDSCDVFYNIFEDPLFEDPGTGNFQITWANYPILDSTMSPCIDAGNPTSPLDPDRTIADMGAFYFDQSATIQISLSPIHPPVMIPPNGGSFSFHATVANASNITQNFDAWCNILVPGGSQFTVLGPVNLTLNAGASLTRLRDQVVPANAPGGEYAFWGFVGDYPWTVTNSDHFPFIKQGSDGDWLGADGWICGGELFPGEIAADDQQPEEFALHEAFPNPFNPTTVLRFELRDASQVNFRVYDTVGRLVATLVDGWREAGTYGVTFDGSRLPSGIYLARLTVGEFTQTQKMVLMK